MITISNPNAQYLSESETVDVQNADELLKATIAEIEKLSRALPDNEKVFPYPNVAMVFSGEGEKRGMKAVIGRSEKMLDAEGLTFVMSAKPVKKTMSADETRSLAQGLIDRAMKKIATPKKERHMIRIKHAKLDS